MQRRALHRWLASATPLCTGRTLHIGTEPLLMSHALPGGTPGSVVTAGVAQPTQRPTSTSPFLAWLPGARGSIIQTPLSQPLAELNLPQPYRPTAQPPPTEITVLPNGARIISEASPGPTASIGMYVNSGSIYESRSNSGSSALLECLAFKSTRHRNSLTLMKEVERVGSTMAAMASREQMSYTMDCLKTSLPATLELLCDAVLNPAFLPQEVEEQKMRLSMLVGSSEVAMTLLNERLVQQAYEGALSCPLIPSPPSLSSLSSDQLAAFYRTNFSGPRLVLAAAGVEHSELVELATPMLSQAPSGDVPPEPTSTYKSTHVRLEGVQAPLCHSIVAWEYSGGWRDVPGAVAMTVLTYLMGGGDSFSSGGPGKGMHSRLYTRVLNHYHWVHSCTAFNATFNATGLVGVQAVCDPNRANDMLDVMCREMEAATRSLSVEEVERAKRTALATICNALENKATSAEDIGRQFLTYGHRISGREYARMIEAVTPADINAFVSRLLQSKPSLAAYGEGSHALSYENLERRFGHQESQSKTSILRGSGDSLKKRVLSIGQNWRS